MHGRKNEDGRDSEKQLASMIRPIAVDCAINVIDDTGTFCGRILLR